MAVVALVLGSIGAAVAGPALTKGKVKKIASQVVKKQASTLSVANAANAANAHALDGQPASSFQNNVTVYSSVVTAPSTNNTFTIPVAPGSYVISYSAYFGAADASDCYLYRQRGATLVLSGEDSADNNLYGSGNSGTGLVSVAAGDVVALVCQRDKLSTTSAGEPVQIVVTKVDNATVGTITPLGRPESRPAR